jgi:hypothetical protein
VRRAACYHPRSLVTGVTVSAGITKARVRTMVAYRAGSTECAKDKPMFRWFMRLLYDSTPTEFRSAYGLAESVERLSAATKRSVFSALGETTAVGKVSEKVVRLQRVIPMVGNSFKPFFIGHFEVHGEVTMLIGKFTMLPLVKVFMSFWFGMCCMFAGAVLLGGFKPQGLNATFFLLQPFLMIGGGIALVAAGKWFARNDAAWLSELIATALGAPRRSASVTPDALMNADADTVPMSLKVAAIFLAASGAMALLAGVAGPQFWPSLGQAGESTAALQLGNWNFIYAILVIALSIGIWGRRPWAWWCGFLLLGLSVCWSLFAMSARADVGPPVGMKVIFAIFSCVVVGIWGRWWYAQRKHFLWS